MHCGDFLKIDELLFAEDFEEDWAAADLVCINSTAFTPQTMHELAQMCNFLKKGTWIFTTTKMLPPNVGLDQEFQNEEESYFVKDGETPIFECVMSAKRKMSWGLGTVHIQRKI